MLDLERKIPGGKSLEDVLKLLNSIEVEKENE